jgi:hypothetical protein
MNFVSFFYGSGSLLEIANSLNAPSWNLYDFVDKLKSHNLINSNN